MSTMSSPPRPQDQESFRRALVALLALAADNGVVVSNTFCKCVAETPGYAWDVQISSMVDSGINEGTEAP